MVLIKVLSIKEKQEKKLTELGIDYKREYIQHRVPCMCRTEAEIKPKNELEFFAAFGVLHSW